MKVCDHCRKGEGLTTLRIREKSYDLCDSCLNRIVTFLNTPEKKGILGELFK